MPNMRVELNATRWNDLKMRVELNATWWNDLKVMTEAYIRVKRHTISCGT
jgi:hypothetical protein